MKVKVLSINIYAPSEGVALINLNDGMYDAEWSGHEISIYVGNYKINFRVEQGIKCILCPCMVEIEGGEVKEVYIASAVERKQK